MRFEIYDTKGRLRVVDCQIALGEMRNYLSEFKTHCAINKSAYEYTHFCNWLAKNYNHELTQISGTPYRVDM